MSGIPNYAGDMNLAFSEVLQQFNPGFPSALHKEQKEAFFMNLLQIIRDETGKNDLQWPEAIFDLSADRICHATALTLGLVDG